MLSAGDANIYRRPILSPFSWKHTVCGPAYFHWAKAAPGPTLPRTQRGYPAQRAGKPPMGTSSSLLNVHGSDPPTHRRQAPHPSGLRASGAPEKSVCSTLSSNRRSAAASWVGRVSSVWEAGSGLPPHSPKPVQCTSAQPQGHWPERVRAVTSKG